MAVKSPEDKIPEEFLTQSYSVLKLEYQYIRKKRQLLISLRRGLKNTDLSEIIEVIQFIRGKPIKSLSVVLGCKLEGLSKKIKAKDKEVLTQLLSLIISKCIDSYTAQMRYIRLQIGSYLNDE